MLGKVRASIDARPLEPTISLSLSVFYDDDNKSTPTRSTTVRTPDFASPTISGVS